MRYGIFSDVHANLQAFRSVEKAYRQDRIDQYLCAGDVVGYGADPRESIKLLQALSCAAVAGNHDWASADLFSLNFFNPLAARAIIWTKTQLDPQEKDFLKNLKTKLKLGGFMLVHGTLDCPEKFHYMINSQCALRTFKAMGDTKICFVGHSHIVGTFIMDSMGSLEYTRDYSIDIKGGFKYIINVGSVGQPRDGNPYAAYCIYDSDSRKVFIKRVEYDFMLARKKIIDAGLPEFLGNRLIRGQ
jgi:predicted phosphodiesterase